MTTTVSTLPGLQNRLRYVGTKRCTLIQLVTDGNKGCKTHASVEDVLTRWLHLDLRIQDCVANNTGFPLLFPTKEFSGFGSGSEQLWESRLAIIGESSPKSTSGFHVVPDHSFGPSIYLLI